MAYKLLFMEAPDGTIYGSTVSESKDSFDDELRFAAEVVPGSRKRSEAETRDIERALTLLAYLEDAGKDLQASSPIASVVTEINGIAESFYVLFEEVFLAGMKYARKKAQDALGIEARRGEEE